MRVGVLSMQDVPNYGSLMQAFSLKQLLNQSGADEIYFLSISPGRILEKRSWKYKIGRLLYYLTNLKIREKLRLDKYSKENKKLFDKFHCLLGENTEDTTLLNMVVIGSDEVFNCCQCASWGYTLQLFGDVDCSYVISYAGSFGHTTLEQLNQYGLADEIGKTMKTLKAISVRDSNSFDIVKTITGINPLIHLDPVLIYGFKSEIELQEVKKYRDYILVYSYNGRINDEEEIENIKDFARKKKKKLYSLFCQYSWCDGELRPDKFPFEIFGFFKYADYVITDTFHGTIFSIITHKNFCSLIRNTNNQKMNSLLRMLDLTQCLVKNSADIEKTLIQTIDYDNVESILLEKREESKSYLQENILKAKCGTSIKCTI